MVLLRITRHYKTSRDMGEMVEAFVMTIRKARCIYLEVKYLAIQHGAAVESIIMLVL